MKLDERFASHLLEKHPEDAAAVFEHLAVKEAMILVRDVSAEIAAPIIIKMESNATTEILRNLNGTETGKIQSELKQPEQTHRYTYPKQ